MKLYSYVVHYDTGFAPNPYFGFCTLGPCKESIRKVAQVGDWVVGIGGAAYRLSGRVTYAMRITEILSWGQYWNDERFQVKKPRFDGASKHAYGDNIYRPEPGVRFIQSFCRHSNPDGSTNNYNFKKDTSADVLVSNDFCYWGISAKPLEPDLTPIVHRGRGGTTITDMGVIEAFVSWFRDQGETGCVGVPAGYFNNRKFHGV